MKKKVIVIFSGYNQRALVAFLRTVTRHGLPYAIIASGENDPLFCTAYAAAILSVRTKKSLEIGEIETTLRQVQRKMPAESYWVAPSTEAMNRFFLDNRAFFKTLSIEIPLVEKPLYELISDKKRFSTYCQERGIPIPAEYSAYKECRIPFVAKPIRYFNAQRKVFSPILVYTKEEQDYFESNYPTDDFYYQELVTGQSYYLLYYFAKSGEIYKFSQKNIAQQPEGKSIVAAEPAEIHLLQPLSSQYEEMFTHLRFHGLVMVEVIQSNNKYVMIEANPRFWGPSQFFVDSGVNFFDFLLYDCGFLPVKPKVTISGLLPKYFWYGGFVLTGKEGKDIVFHCPSDIQSHPDEWMKHDVYRRDDTIGIYNQETAE